MSIIGKGYFINPSGAVIHIVAPRDSTITLNHYTDYSLAEIDKTIIKTYGQQRAGRTWVSDYYIRIPEKLYGYWRFSGVGASTSGSPVLHCMSGTEFTGNTRNSELIEINEKKEYLGACYLNTPILDYDDLYSIYTNGFEDTVYCQDAVISLPSRTDSSVSINLTSSSTNPNTLDIKNQMGEYVISPSGVPDISTGLSGKWHIIINTTVNKTTTILTKSKEPTGITTTSVSLVDNTGHQIISIPYGSTVYIRGLAIINNTQCYLVDYYTSEYYSGYISKDTVNFSGFIYESAGMNIPTNTLKGYTQFWGSYKPSNGNPRSYPSYYYPVRRISDGKIGIVQRYFTLDGWEESYIEKFVFLTEDNINYNYGPIRNSREAWIES